MEWVMLAVLAWIAWDIRSRCRRLIRRMYHERDQTERRIEAMEAEMRKQLDRIEQMIG